MSEIPEVPYRFGERYLVTDFVMVGNVAIKEQAEKLASNTFDETVYNVAEWIRDNFYYPLDNGGNPAAQGQLLRHQKGFGGWHFKKCVYYMWSLPNEVLLLGCGICICTSNLVESVLRARQMDKAWVCLGDVMDLNDQLLGRHAWIECPYKADTYVMETTIHNGRANLFKASEVYDKRLPWAQRTGIYYVLQARYNELEYIGEGPLGAQIIQLMALPIKRVSILGVEKALAAKPKRLFKEWRGDEIVKQRAIWRA